MILNILNNILLKYFYMKEGRLFEAIIDDVPIIRSLAEVLAGVLNEIPMTLIKTPIADDSTESPKKKTTKKTKSQEDKDGGIEYYNGMTMI